jgi:hypothetical protein
MIYSIYVLIEVGACYNAMPIIDQSTGIDLGANKVQISLEMYLFPAIIFSYSNFLFLRALIKNKIRMDEEMCEE